MDRTGKIELEGMEFHAYHGCFEEEKTSGNLFVVDFTVPFLVTFFCSL